MPLTVSVTNIKFLNEFKNDVGFASNPSDTTPNMAGHIMERQKAVYEVDVTWTAAVTSGDTWTVPGGGLNVIVRSTGSWYADGFTVGDICDWIQGAAFAANITITAISNNGRSLYYTLNTGSITDSSNATLLGITPLTALINGFGLIENNDSFSIESEVTGNDQAFYGAGIGADLGGGVRDTNFVNMTPQGSVLDWRTGSMRARFVGNPINGTQRFEIEHEFVIPPWYIDGELSNIQNNIMTPLFSGQNSLKYVFNPELRSSLSNPLSSKSVKIDNQLGSVAWYGENFNGFQNNYQVNSINYEEQATTNSASGLLIGSKTKVTIEVQKNNGNFSVGERAGVYVSYLPSQAEYTNTTLTDLIDNFIYDNAVNSNGLASVNGQDFIENFEIINISGNTMDLVFEVDYSTLQKVRLSNLNSQGDIYYVIGVQLGDNSLSSANSDRVMLIGDVNQYDESADIPDLLEFTKFDIYSHDRIIGIDSGNTDLTAWIEDGIALDYTMSLNLNKSAVLNSLDFILLAYNPSTENYFELDKYSYNIFPSVVSSGIQQLSLNSTRGYILDVGSQFNKAELSTGANALGFQEYDGVIGQKFSWQDWIQNLNVDTVFYDSSKPNNNLNNKSSNYSLLNGYEIRIAFFGNLSGVSDLGVSGFTDYLYLSQPLTTYNYEEDGNITPIWSCNMETFDASGTNNLGGAILTGQDTLYRWTWTNSGGPVTSLTGIWGINRIEETGDVGYQITEISSLYNQPSGQILKPISGSTLFMYLNSGNVVMECLIDGSIAQSGLEYNLSSRIHDSNALVDGKETESGVLKDTEAGIIKEIE